MRQHLIESKLEVSNGKPVLKGTRVTVRSVLELLEAGENIDEMLKAYPSITREQVLACMERA